MNLDLFRLITRFIAGADDKKMGTFLLLLSEN